MGLQVWYTHKTRNIVFPVCVTMTYRMKRMNTKRTEKSQLIVISITWIIKRIPFNVQFQHLAKKGQKLLRNRSVCLVHFLHFVKLNVAVELSDILRLPSCSFWIGSITLLMTSSWRDATDILFRPLLYAIKYIGVMW